MKSALVVFKNALAVAFAPIIQTVVPYLVTFIKTIANALNLDVKDILTFQL